MRMMTYFIEVTMKWCTYIYYLKCSNYESTLKYVWVQPYLHILTVVDMEESGYSEYNDLHLRVTFMFYIVTFMH